MSFETKLVEDILIIRFTLDRATVDISGEFKNELLEELEKDNIKVVIDLSKAEYVDSSFLGVLVAGLKRATMKNGDLKLVGLQPAVRAMFDLTRLYRIFDLYDNVEDAINAF